MKCRSTQGCKRRGRCKPAPYTKYNKAPYQYSSAYHSWRAKIVGSKKSQAAQ